MYIFLKSTIAHAHQQVIFIYEVLLYTNEEVLGTFQSLKIDVPRVFMGSLSLFLIIFIGWVENQKNGNQISK